MAVSFAKIGAHETVRLRILAFPGVSIKGVHVDQGEIVIVPGGDALFLVGSGRAEAVANEPVPEVKALEPEPSAPEPEKPKAKKTKEK